MVLSQGPEVWESEYYEYSRPPASEVFIKGRIDSRGRLDFGIGTYFVPEGTGHIIEGAQGVKVVVKLDAGGNAIIKQVLVDGEAFDPDS